MESYPGPSSDDEERANPFDRTSLQASLAEALAAATGSLTGETEPATDPVHRAGELEVQAFSAVGGAAPPAAAEDRVTGKGAEDLDGLDELTLRGWGRPTAHRLPAAAEKDDGAADAGTAEPSSTGPGPNDAPRAAQSPRLPPPVRAFAPVKRATPAEPAESSSTGSSDWFQTDGWSSGDWSAESGNVPAPSPITRRGPSLASLSPETAALLGASPPPRAGADEDTTDAAAPADDVHTRQADTPAEPASTESPADDRHTATSPGIDATGTQIPEASPPEASADEADASGTAASGAQIPEEPGAEAAEDAAPLAGGEDIAPHAGGEDIARPGATSEDTSEHGPADLGTIVVHPGVLSEAPGSGSGLAALSAAIAEVSAPGLPGPGAERAGGQQSTGGSAATAETADATEGAGDPGVAGTAPTGDPVMQWKPEQDDILPSRSIMTRSISLRRSPGPSRGERKKRLGTQAEPSPASTGADLGFGAALPTDATAGWEAVAPAGTAPAVATDSPTPAAEKRRSRRKDREKSGEREAARATRRGAHPGGSNKPQRGTKSTSVLNRPLGELFKKNR